MGEIANWAAGYREKAATALFFDGYKELRRVEGNDPKKNFFSGSDLLGMYEVEWCKVLRWLLDCSSGAEGAERLQEKLLEKAKSQSTKPFSVVGREVDDGSRNRYDIEMTEGEQGLLIEAKVNALRDDEQLKRYAESYLKKRPSGKMLFLTKSEEVKLPSLWKPVTWGDVARMVNEILETPMQEGAVDVLWAKIAEDFSSYITIKM